MELHGQIGGQAGARGYFDKLTEPLRSLLRRRRFRQRLKVSPLKLVIGASGIYQPGWVPSDIRYLNLLNGDHWRAYFDEDSIDAMLAEHVWEHLTIEEGLVAAGRCFKYLKPGGYLRVAVPDGFHPDEQYISHVRPGGSGPGADDHKVLYDHRSFAELFAKAGFRVTLLEYFNANGEFNFVDWTPEDGKINRSIRFDERNADGTPNYTSIVLDAVKDR